MSRMIAVANEFIRRAEAQGVEDFSPVKLHDVMYLAQGWRIGSASEMLFESPVMAHQDGVFLKELRAQGCWGTKRIDAPIEIFTESAQGMLTQFVPQMVAGDPAMVTIDYVWDLYGKLTVFDTTNHTREPGSPWDLTWNSPDRASDEPQEIPLELIRRWYAAQFKLRALAGMSKIKARVRTEDEHDEATELHMHPSADHLRSA